MLSAVAFPIVPATLPKAIGLAPTKRASPISASERSIAVVRRPAALKISSPVVTTPSVSLFWIWTRVSQAAVPVESSRSTTRPRWVLASVVESWVAWIVSASYAAAVAAESQESDCTVSAMSTSPAPAASPMADHAVAPPESASAAHAHAVSPALRFGI